jgi:hypothetical protein
LRVKELPGVTQVMLTSDLPYTSRGNSMSLKIENQAAPRGLAQDALFRLVSHDYLQTIGRASAQGVSSTTGIVRARRRLSTRWRASTGRGRARPDWRRRLPRLDGWDRCCSTFHRSTH